MRVTLLQALQSPHSELIKNSLPETLKRELREEAALLFESHYTFKPWRRLKPYYNRFMDSPSSFPVPADNTTG